MSWDREDWAFDHHPPCPSGCGELADECACPTPNPWGSMTITTADSNPFRDDLSNRRATP